MGLVSSPNVVRDSLIVNLDASSIRSFQGVARTNYAKGVTFSSGGSNTSTYKYTQGTEVVNIPQIGKRTVSYVDHWNDYNGGSGQCCPNLFYYHTSGIYLSPSTTYTYSLIYKTTTGYTHPNFMYRYEYNSSGTYLTEQGIHNDSNRTHLGDGWYYAWGQFTTQSTTSYIVAYLFYYQYATWDRIYVDRVSIVAGSTVPDIKHITAYDSTNTGNLVNLVGTDNGTLVNGPTYDSSNGGSLVFDGTNDYIAIPHTSAKWTPSSASTLNYITIELWIKTSDTSGYYISRPWNGNGEYNYLAYNGGLQLVVGNQSNTVSVTGFADNTWRHVVYWISPTQFGSYVDGGNATSGNHGITNNTPASGDSNLSLNIMTLYPYGEGWGGNTGFSISGNIGLVRVYNKVLTANEVLQNYNATRQRFGV